MASETDLLNDSLGQIGALPVTAIDDGSVNANYCLRFYPTLRDSIIRSHHWNFALKWQQLSPDVTGPIADFAYAYTLPPYCLKVIDYGGNLPSTPPIVLTLPDPFYRYLARYKIEGRKLVSNDGTAFIHYLRRVTNPDEWDPLMYQATAMWLASKLASAITKDLKLSNALLTQATQILMPLAMSVDGQEGSIEPYLVDDLIWGR